MSMTRAVRMGSDMTVLAIAVLFASAPAIWGQRQFACEAEEEGEECARAEVNTPQGNPEYDIGAWLNGQTDHMVTIKRVAAGTQQFYYRFRSKNENNDNVMNSPAHPKEIALGGTWEVDYFEVFTRSDMINGSYLIGPEGQYQLNAHTQWMIKDVDSNWIAEEEDTGNFEVVEP